MLANICRTRGDGVNSAQTNICDLYIAFTSESQRKVLKRETRAAGVAGRGHEWY